jgi:predicted GTPase
MPTNDNQTLDLFNSLMHKLGVKETSKEFSGEEDTKMDVLKSEIFLREKPKIGIIGKIRAGKSTLGNAIFGEKAFKAGKALELTQEVSSITLPSGIVIYDTPGFEGFSNYEAETRKLMSECDLLLHVIRYPGALDKGAVDFFKEEIEPLGKPVVTVVNVNEGEPLEGWEAIFEKATDKLGLPNMVYVYAEKDTHTHVGFILKYVENLVIKMCKFWNYVGENLTITWVIG